MIIDCPSNPSRTLLNNRFAFHYFNKQVAPLGNCVTFLGPWNGHKAGLSSNNAIHFWWEIPRQLSYSGVEINWLLLPSIATHLSTLTGHTTEILDNSIRTFSSNNSTETFGIVTCDVSSRLLVGATVGHIALHIEPGTDCFPLSVGLQSLISRFDNSVAHAVMKNGIQSFYTLTSKLFFTESILGDNL